MAILNRDSWVWRFGQVGKVMRGRLDDANGRVNLDQFDSVQVQVGLTSTSALLLDAEAVPDDQTTDNGAAGTTGRGWFSYTTDTDAAAIPAKDSTYLLSFVGVDGTVPQYFPESVSGQRQFANLKVNDPLGV